MQEIRPLTSLRGLLALWVVVLHIFIAGLDGRIEPPRFAHAGYLAVDAFFFLSGFILAGTYGARFRAGFRRDVYAVFLLRRWGRLFPLHIAVMAAILAVRPAPLMRVIEELTLTQRWNIWPKGGVDWVNLPSWSISTEWLANILFPAFVWWGLSGSRWRSAANVAGGAGLLIWAAAEHHWDLNIWRSATSILPMARCFGDFALGVSAFAFRERLPALNADWAIAMLSAVLAAALAFGANDLVVVALLFPIILAIAGNHGRVARLLSAAPLHWLGEISYSIYLIHYSLVLMLTPILSGPGPERLRVAAYVAATLGATVGLSAMTYKRIETPARRWARSLEGPVVRALG